jgi:nicotinate-nucleotide adenylyltransferase
MGDLIGVFGGTFDPPHLGHCILAAEAKQRLNLAKVYWLPAGQPPHKPDWPISLPEHRLEMVKRITDADPQFESSLVDIDRSGPHYAKDTLALLQEADPTADFVYLMGADSLRDLIQWKDPQIFVERAHAIGIMQRPWIEYDLDALQQAIPGLDEKLMFFPAPLIDISGQIIRQRLKAGMPVRYMLTEAVYQYICEHQLYLE